MCVCVRVRVISQLICSPVLDLLFKLVAMCGDEIVYVLCLPAAIWTASPDFARHLIYVWCFVYYVLHYVKVRARHSVACAHAWAYGRARGSCATADGSAGGQPRARAGLVQVASAQVASRAPAGERLHPCALMLCPCGRTA